MRWWPAVLGLGIGLAAIALGLTAGADPAEQWQLAARWTARAGFPLLLLAYAAGPLARLAPGGLTRALVGQRRWWGLGFAAAHCAHLVALLRFFAVSGKPVPAIAALGGAAVYLALFLMAFTSFPAAQRALGRHWKLIHRIGIHALGAVFALAWTGKALAGVEPWVAPPFALLIWLAMALRFAAWRRRNGTTVPA